MTLALPAGLHETREGGCLLWTIDRPRRRNAITPEMLEFMGGRALELDGEVVVITATGDIAFCAGFDLDALKDSPPDPPPDHTLVACTNAIDQARAVFIAALPGYAIGAGVELACACDFRLGSRAVSFRVPAGKLGVVYHRDGVVRMRAVLGRDATARLLLCGDTLPAQILERAGGLEIPDSGDPRSAALARAESICAQSVEGVVAHRLLLRALDRVEMDEAVAHAHETARRRAWERLAAD